MSYSLGQHVGTYCLWILKISPNKIQKQGLGKLQFFGLICNAELLRSLPTTGVLACLRGEFRFGRFLFDFHFLGLFFLHLEQNVRSKVVGKNGWYTTCGFGNMICWLKKNQRNLNASKDSNPPMILPRSK